VEKNANYGGVTTNPKKEAFIFERNIQRYDSKGVNRGRTQLAIELRRNEK
jgi:hypothetical protein